ncbi:hypothetical protein ON010_g18767 [Phytophthora cinnamomi]|nr:hypothetical protein ON010_g18767 [Phytophthora cinnamomi]
MADLATSPTGSRNLLQTRDTGGHPPPRQLLGYSSGVATWHQRKRARKALKQSDDAQERDNQSRGAKDASGSRKATEDRPASGDKHQESKQEGSDEKNGRGSGNGGESKGLSEDAPASDADRRTRTRIRFSIQCGESAANAEYSGISASRLISAPRPAYWLVSPCYADSEPPQLVGVPASEMVCHNGAHLRGGYGGLEVLHILERFSDQDMNDLNSLRSLLRELREKTWDAGSFSDFLDRESSMTVSGNWKRLQEVFAHISAGVRPPSSWITNIHVFAADQPHLHVAQRV